MSSYRFCRTDDMALLVEACEICRGPEETDLPALDLAGFKRLVRDLDLWCSSCMVALEGRVPVAVLLGAKRPRATLVHTVRVHPDHRRRGHGRHLLTSLGQKLAILGPPRLEAEVPAERAGARALFEACHWTAESELIDWRRTGTGANGRAPEEEGPRSDLPISPITVEEALSSGLLGDSRSSLRRSWHRDLPSLDRQSERLFGLGFHSPERLEAFALASPEDESGSSREVVAAAASPTLLGRLGLRLLLNELESRSGGGPLVMSRVAPDEFEPGLLAELGFEAGSGHTRFVTEARAA